MVSVEMLIQQESILRITHSIYICSSYSSLPDNSSLPNRLRPVIIRGFHGEFVLVSFYIIIRADGKCLLGKLSHGRQITGTRIGETKAERSWRHHLAGSKVRAFECVF